jgi:hypothetical protein
MNLSLSLGWACVVYECVWCVYECVCVLMYVSCVYTWCNVCAMCSVYVW